MLEVNRIHGDDGVAYYAKGFVPLDEFMDAVKLHEGEDFESIPFGEPTHCWMRTVRDFQENQTMFTEAAPNSRGAFKCTWIQEY
jgi:hypothetical protein